MPPSLTISPCPSPSSPGAKRRRSSANLGEQDARGEEERRAGEGRRSSALMVQTMLEERRRSNTSVTMEEREEIRRGSASFLLGEAEEERRSREVIEVREEPTDLRMVRKETD